MSKDFNPVRGCQDFLPKEVELRNKIENIISSTYLKYGFLPIQTPVLESLDFLESSEGGDNLRIIYKILKRKDKLVLPATNEKDLTDIGLRYDLTVPLIRFYINNENELLFPFKAIQLGEVFRAERPQKGRSRQFRQCDIDIIGEDSIDNEIEILNVASNTLINLGFSDFEIKINNRKLINKVLIKLGVKEEEISKVLISLDKLDKITKEEIVKELIAKDIKEEVTNKIINFIKEDNKIEKNIKDLLKKDEDLEKVEKIIKGIKDLSDGKYKINFDFSIIRGQEYYTDSVFEIYLKGFNGAIGGGGRYNNIINKLTNRIIPAVGYSFGFERLFLILKDNLSLDKDKVALIYEDEEISEVIKYREIELKNEVVLIQKKKKNFRFQLESLRKEGVSYFVEFKNKQVTKLEEI